MNPHDATGGDRITSSSLPADDSGRQHGYSTHVWRQWLVTAGYAFISGGAIVVRLHKADVAGIVHDEAITFQLFGQHFHDALTLYPFSNNHVINSLLICLVKPLAGMHEHFIRLPSLVFAIMFVLISWQMCTRLFSSPAIGLACHAALVLSWYPLDLSIQARAYGGLMACNLAIIWLLSAMARKWGGVSLWGATGFGALLGLSVAMLPTNAQFATVAALAFMTMLVTPFRRHMPQRADNVDGPGFMAKGIMAALAGAIVVGMTYAQVASQIVAFFRKLDDHYSTAARFVQQSFGWWYLHSLVAGDVGTVMLVAAACGLVVVMGWSAVADLRGGTGRNGAARRVVMTTIGGYVLLLVVLNYSIGMSLGFARNRVDVFLFFLLAGALAMDHGVTVLRQGSSRSGRVAEIAAATVMWTFGGLLLPRLDYIYADNVAYQSAIGPFIRQAVAVAPDREWRFRFSPQVNFCAEIVEYYAAVRPAYRVRVCEPRYGTHMGVSGPQAARNWKAAVTTEPPNVYVSRSREPTELAVESPAAVPIFLLAGLRFECLVDER